VLTEVRCSKDIRVLLLKHDLLILKAYARMFKIVFVRAMIGNSKLQRLH
jgi:hypothetical protein